MNNSKSKRTPRMPQKLKSALGDPVLLRNERESAYSNLADSMAAAVHPEDNIEWVYLRDFVDAEWDLVRLRRYRAVVVNDRRGAVAAVVLGEIENPKNNVFEQERKGLDALKVMRKPDGEINETALRESLEIGGRDPEILLARAIGGGLYGDSIDKMIIAAEKRRDIALRSIMLWREQKDRFGRVTVDHDTRPMPRLVPATQRKIANSN